MFHLRCSLIKLATQVRSREKTTKDLEIMGVWLAKEMKPHHVALEYGRLNGMESFTGEKPTNRKKANEKRSYLVCVQTRIYHTEFSCRL